MSHLDHTRIARALAAGTLVADRVFDEVFPLALRSASNVYWTPVEVAVRAARHLAPERHRSIVDIGAGVGKFCIVAAATVDAEVHGIEHRPHLVNIARAAASKVGVRPSFDHGQSIDELDASSIDGIYMFNPFAENLCPAADQLDATVELSAERFWKDLDATVRLLERARAGTRVATYCGFGGKMPEGFALVSRERVGGTLELWEKRVEPESGAGVAQPPRASTSRANASTRDAKRRGTSICGE